jgi:hypothetical protein
MILCTPWDLGSRRKERRNGPATPSTGGNGTLMSDADILARSSIPWVTARSSATISIAGLVLCLLAPPPARAQNLVTDGSFETTQLGEGDYEYVNGLLNGWLYSGEAVLINVADNSPWTTPSQTGYLGNQVAGIQNTGSISQTFAASGTGAFDVTWLDTGRPNYAAQNYTVSVLNDSMSAIVSSETLTVTPGANFSPETLVAGLVAGDTYSLTFQGLDSSGGTQRRSSTMLTWAARPHLR